MAIGGTGALVAAGGAADGTWRPLWNTRAYATLALVAAALDIAVAGVSCLETAAQAWATRGRVGTESDTAVAAGLELRRANEAANLSSGAKSRPRTNTKFKALK
jgi:hypothetical protein